MAGSEASPPGTAALCTRMGGCPLWSRPTVIVTEGPCSLWVVITGEDFHARMVLVDSFRYHFDPHGRRYSKPLRPGWSLPYWKRARLIAWLSMVEAVVEWEGGP
jgi:hypothetical protein